MTETKTQKILSFCSVSELKEKQVITKWLDEYKDEISAFYAEEKIYVYSTICPHFGGDFDYDGESCHLTCKWHGWKFDLKTGKSLTELEHYKSRSLIRRIMEHGNDQLLGCFPYKGKLREYEYQINNDTLEVIIP